MTWSRRLRRSWRLRNPGGSPTTNWNSTRPRSAALWAVALMLFEPRVVNILCVFVCFRPTGRLDSTSCWRSIQAQPNSSSCKRRNKVYDWHSILLFFFFFFNMYWYLILWLVKHEDNPKIIIQLLLFRFYKITQNTQTQSFMLILYSRNIFQNGGGEGVTH